MIKVGLTGNIGSGKSVVCRIFGILGAGVYDADFNAKKFLKKEEVKEQIIKSFGTNVLGSNGEVDRKALALAVFGDRDKLSKLNSIIHPLVIEDFNTRIETLMKSSKEEAKPKYFILESAILFETGYNSLAEKIITVSCPESIRINRIMKRDNSTREEAEARIKSQLEESEKIKQSDFVIVNDDKQLVTPQVLAIHNLLIS